jgi:serine/threonine protein kinase
MTYNSPKKAIAGLAKISQRTLRRLKVSGIENDGIYATKTRIFKLCGSRREYLAAKRLIGKDFSNVVKVYHAYECDIYYSFSDHPLKTYVIEEERLYRSGRNFVFDYLCLSDIYPDVNRRLPYFVGVINGLAELASVGIIHNDLHTLNVMSDASGQVKIIDFGFAKIKRVYDAVNVRAKTVII